MKKHNWAAIGCGAIARQFAQAMRAEGRTLYAVAGRTHEKTAAFAEEYGIPHAYESISQVFTDENVDIVYIATPHNTHSAYIDEALRHGKHVLCEKAITLDIGELSRAQALAQERGLILAEAMTIYHMPLYKRLRELMESGALGKLRMVQMNFGSFKEYDMTNRFFNPALAGGALWDIGVYALSFIRWFMSCCPDQIASQVRYAPSGVDEQVGILLANKAGEMATAALTLHAKQPKRGVAAFEKGYVEIEEYPRAEKAVIVYTEDGRRELLECGSAADALRYEIRDMEQAVAGGPDEMYLDYTRDVSRMMTEIRKKW
ncbi:MAG TPA: Gfo/Idh/MocA family oxidoreductase [Candidatus Eisenbergiella merdavium]|uniref:Gfo/Idh/MocA family oxidoreductase n=1 Tax=Candidatus Eisenbergiella merdavium TaxID=2838551 RepID=A0A9D2NB08_9FIRM|nr:Gfo/Idh/MocA family oxidoreductase [Candidatus Eisenbergiella merdavium]